MSMHLMHRCQSQDMVLASIQSLPAIPAGAIFLYAGGSAPTGWAFKNFASPAYVRGYGSGAVELDILQPEVRQTVTVGAAGEHLGEGRMFAKNNGSAGTSTHPAHDHPGAVENSVPEVDRLRIRLLKASVDTDDLPANVVWLSYSPESKTGWTRVSPETPGDACLVGDPSTVAWVDADTSVGVTLPTEGNHNHGGDRGGQSGLDSGSVDALPAGIHSHPGSVITPSISLKGNFFNAWFRAVEYSLRDVKGVYALWDQPDPPTGWVLMDGENGTPDIAGNEIMLAKSQANGGTFNGGSGLASASGATIADGVHHHQRNGVVSEGLFGYHWTIEGTEHTHSLSYTGKVWTPEHVFLHVIKRIW